MKIISKFKDYYDSAIGQGIDPNLIYLREKKEIKVKNNPDDPAVGEISSSWFHRSTLIDSSYYSFHAYLLGFCGKIYPMIYVKKVGEDKGECFYKFETFKDSVYGKSIDGDKKMRRWMRSQMNGISTQVSTSNIEDFFNQNTSRLTSVFAEYNTPVFLYGRWNQHKEIRTNPTLKNFEFYKVQDPFSCFQELSMFVGGVLKSPEKPMVELTDKDRIAKHGFDKHSFRKLPEKNK